MDDYAILKLLNNIQNQKQIGAASVEVVVLACEKGLINRTETGNFELSEGGIALLGKNKK